MQPHLPALQALIGRSRALFGCFSLHGYITLAQVRVTRQALLIVLIKLCMLVGYGPVGCTHSDLHTFVLPVAHSAQWCLQLSEMRLESLA